LSGSMNNTPYLNIFGFDNIEYEVLVDNQHSVTDLFQLLIFRNYAKVRI